MSEEDIVLESVKLKKTVHFGETEVLELLDCCFEAPGVAVGAKSAITNERIAQDRLRLLGGFSSLDNYLERRGEHATHSRNRAPQSRCQAEDSDSDGFSSCSDFS